ncbi:hypothetical protein LDL59_15150 [Kaistella anthropi]|nr:hypothetical protein [Kaistella anthropi]
MEENIREKTMLTAKYIANPKYYLVIIRRISAEITEHVKVTTDKFGEVYLNLFWFIKSWKTMILLRSKDSTTSINSTFI